MSYTDKVKDELLRREEKNDCCKRARILGFLQFGRMTDNSRHIYRTASAALAKYASDALASQLGVTADFLPPARTDREKPRYGVSIAYSEEAGRLAGTELVPECERCAGSFLAGAFLAAGYAADPEKSFRAEIACPDERRTLMAERILSEMDISSGRTVRRELCSIIIKGKQSLEDFYALIGATNASMDVINAAIGAQLAAETKRKINYEIANLEKAASAGMQQSGVIERYLRKHRLSSLPPELRELAKLRVENPYSSLGELAELMPEKITKSGMYHRMKRLTDYCEEKTKGG